MMSYGFYLIFFIATFVPYILYGIYTANNYIYGITQSSYYNYGENTFLPLLLNPAVYLVEFFAELMTGESVVNMIPGMMTAGPINFVATGHNWMIVSTILFLAVSFLFLWLAARRINPIRRRTRKRKLKQAV